MKQKLTADIASGNKTRLSLGVETRTSELEGWSHEHNDSTDFSLKELLKFVYLFIIFLFG